MTEKKFDIKKTVRYCTLGNLNNQTKNVWFVCHGYGQLARFFISKFDVLNDGHSFIVAPEAFHRFYLNGFDGKVGASWMTKEDRLNDIDDYITYLDSLYQYIFKESSLKNIKINILGFSQGAATVCRWAQNTHIPIANLIIWAGLFPPEIDFNKIVFLNKAIKLYLVYGSEDEYLNLDDFYSPELLLSKSQIPFEKIVFPGKHSLDQETLVILKNTIDR